ncbi:hypothetical protein WJX77_003520 [Trebouxia sp. C0004]
MQLGKTWILAAILEGIYASFGVIHFQKDVRNKGTCQQKRACMLRLAPAAEPPLPILPPKILSSALGRSAACRQSSYTGLHHTA